MPPTLKVTRFLPLGVCIILAGLICPGYAYEYDGFHITPRASVGESYDDNITYVKEDPVTDEISRLLAGTEIKKENESESFVLDTSIEEELFARHSSFDNTSEFMNLQYKQALSQVSQVKLNDVFSHSEEPRSFESAFGSTAGRYFTYDNAADFGFRHDLNDQLALNFRYANELLEFTSRNLSDSSMDKAGAGLEYVLNPTTSAMEDYDYIYRDFYPGSAVTENELTAGVRHYFAPHLYGDLRSGADFISSFSGKDYIQPLYKASITKDLDDKSDASFSFVKGYTTTGYIQDLFDSWSVSGNYYRKLTRKVTATIDIFYGDGDYVTTPIHDKYSGASIDASYAWNRETTIDLSYTFSQDDSTLPTNSYLKNVVLLKATYEFQ